MVLLHSRCVCSFECLQILIRSPEGGRQAVGDDNDRIPTMSPRCLPARRDRPPRSACCSPFRWWRWGRWGCPPSPLPLSPDLRQKTPTLPQLLSPQGPDTYSLWKEKVCPTTKLMPQRIFSWLSSQRSLDLCVWFDVGWGQGNLPFGTNEKEEGKEAPGWVLLGVTCCRCIGLFLCLVQCFTYTVFCNSIAIKS